MPHSSQSREREREQEAMGKTERVCMCDGGRFGKYQADLEIYRDNSRCFFWRTGYGMRGQEDVEERMRRR